MKRIKKIISVLLAAVMIFGSAAIGISDIEPSVLSKIFSPKAEAASYSGTCGENLTWSFDEITGTLTINGIGNMIDFHNVSYTPWYEYIKQRQVKNIVFENGITSISNFAFENALSLESVSLPESLLSIGDYAFMGNVFLKDVSLPQNIKSIGSASFYDCGFSSIHIPAGLLTIGESAFFSCNKLNVITVDSQNKAFSSDEFGVLYGQNILIQYPAANKRTSFEIPANITEIGRGAFYGCENLTSIKFTNNITSIDNNAFGFCNNLKDVYFIGTEEEWNKITINQIGNSNLTNAKIHFLEHTHSYTSSLTSIATCNKEGIITYTCSCGNSYTEDIPQLKHTSSDWIITSNETCTQYGTKITKCTICEETIQTETIPSTGHKPGSWETTLEPTIESEGKKIKKCIICGTQLEEAIIKKLSYEPIKDNLVMTTPSTTTINYGDAIILHIDASKIPEGGYVVWSASNGNFNYSANGTTCKISPSSSGDTTFTATVYDAEGNAVSADEQTMTSKAGFFQKIIAFFKKLFGLTKTISSVFKF